MVQRYTLDIDVVICYGLGPISRSIISQHQLAVALKLGKAFDCDVLAYDPIFDKDDIEILKACDVQICTYPIPEIYHDFEVFLFMPHCEAEVYRNLELTDHYGDTLNRVWIYGNKQSEEDFPDHTIYFEKVPIKYQRDDVFNDCFLFFSCLKI